MEEFNYFNYFTEIEEYFWRKRGAHLLVSPLDWAIVETWQKSGIPLNSVLKGIDRAFESYGRSKRAAGGRALKSLAYCVDAVLDAATEAQEAAAGAGPEVDGGGSAEAGGGAGASRGGVAAGGGRGVGVARAKRAVSEPFSRDELRKYLRRNTEKLKAAEEKQAGNAALAGRLAETARRLGEFEKLAEGEGALDLEDLERQLTILEEKITPMLHAAASEEVLLEIRRDLDRQLAPYRRKMSNEQFAQLDRQYLQKRLFESFGVPRLSLFYLI
jgi:hypothetical protein